jgi:hypothetical protein
LLGGSCSSEEIKVGEIEKESLPQSATEEEIVTYFYAKSITKENTMDLRNRENIENFKNAWYNKYDSPSENNHFSGDRFEYEEKKEFFKSIRKTKYLILESYDSIVFRDYDFKNQVFPVKNIPVVPPYMELEKSYWVPGQYGTRIRFGGNQYGQILLPIEKEKAKEIYQLLHQKEYKWTLLWEIKSVKDSQLTTCASLKDINNFWLYAVKTCTQEGWEKSKIRSIKLGLLAYIVKDNKGNFILAGKAISKD